MTFALPNEVLECPVDVPECHGGLVETLLQ